jgi:hypothetical protein
MQRARSWFYHAAAFVAVAVLLYPLFFVIYRTMIFDTIPRDDYAPFLLWVAGAEDGVFPASPYGYRLLTMFAALPFHFGLPPLRLTNLPDTVTVSYMNATAAIAALSYLSSILAGFLCYRTARDQCAFGRRDALLAGVMLFALCWHAQMFGIDAVSIMMVAAAVCALPHAAVFTAIMLISVGFNEKVGIVLVIWLTVRVVLVASDRRHLRTQWLAALAAILLYGALLIAVDLPGHEYQTQPLRYLATLQDNLRTTMSGRGVLLNIAPTVILVLVAAAGWRRARHIGLFHPVDLLVIPALVMVSLVLTESLQMGRIVMHAAPLFAIPGVAALAAWADRDASRSPHAPLGAAPRPVSRRPTVHARREPPPEIDSHR